MIAKSSGVLVVLTLALCLLTPNRSLSQDPSGSTQLVTTNAIWRYHPGITAASQPADAWRSPEFSDTHWPPRPAPFHYGEGIQIGSEVQGMRGNHSSILLRHHFSAPTGPRGSDLILRAVCDDGFVAWLNGVEVARYNMPAGAITFSSFANAAVLEPAPFLDHVLTDTAALLTDTGNVLAIQVFNNQIQSSDLIFDAALFALVPDTEPPRVIGMNPPPGTVLNLTRLEIIFSEPVTGVEPWQLWINGEPASSVSMSLSGSGAAYTFSFPQPEHGAVEITWDPDAEILDLASPPNRFDTTSPESTGSYLLTDSLPPTIAQRLPFQGVTVTDLSSIEILFTEAVRGVRAEDLIINGQPALRVSGQLAGPYIFEVPQVLPGSVSVEWDSNHKITDLASSPNRLQDGPWEYFIDPEFEPPPVRINEILTSRGAAATQLDEDGDPSDWIEIYNPGPGMAQLGGWRLTDDPLNPNKWIFPPTTLPAGGYLLIHASGKDRRPSTPSTPRHTNFRLSVSGEYLALLDASLPPRIMSEFENAYPEQRPGYSYGQINDGSWRYFTQPTPRQSNGSSTISVIAPPVQFDVPAGIHETAFPLELTVDLADAVIRYTVNGSEPTTNQGILYTGPIAIDRTRTVRASAFHSDALPSETATATYLFLADVRSQPAQPGGFPDSWGQNGNFPNSRVPADYEMDPQITEHPQNAGQIESALRSLPSISIVMDLNDLFGVQGIYSNPTRRTPSASVSNVERPCSVEWIDPTGGPGFQINCGLRIQGGASREPQNSPKHSLRLLFKREYGPGQLDFPLFPESPVQSFNSLILRAEYNNSWIHWGADQRQRGSYARDQWMRDTQIAMSGMGSRSRYVHVYLNGLYWGVYNPSERIDAAFAASHLGGTREQQDVFTQRGLRDGSSTSWNQLFQLVRGPITQQSTYQQVAALMDLEQFADYMIVNLYGGNSDWPHNNWSVAGAPTAGRPFRFFCWDAEHTNYNLQENRVNVNNSNTPGELYSRLRTNPEFRLLFADRVQKHFFDNGPLSPQNVVSRFKALTNTVGPAILGESARWGDYRRDVHVRGTARLYTTQNDWQPEVASVINNYLPNRSEIVIQQFRNAGLYTSVQGPRLMPFGGRLAQGERIRLAASVGASSIYYTTDGSDPRTPWTGEIAPTALLYNPASGGIPITKTTQVKARVFLNNAWSSLAEAAFETGPPHSPVSFTEIMFHPPGGDAFEFIELQNRNPVAVDISGYHFDGITFVFPAATIVEPDQVIVLASAENPDAFAMRYPDVTPIGHFEGRLSDSGERLALLNPKGRRIDAVHFAQGSGWAEETRGGGYTLERIDFDSDPNAPASWSRSMALHGSPGSVQPSPQLPQIVISEFLAHNVQGIPHEDAFPDWIELHNRSDMAVDLSDWSLTDGDNPRRYVFPAGTRIEPDEFLVVWCTEPLVPGQLYAPFALDRQGETVLLYDASGRRIDAVSFGPQITNLSMARTGEDLSWNLAIPTPGAANETADVAPTSSLVVNEWMAASGPGAEDWIEIWNSDTTLPLDLRGYTFDTPEGSQTIQAASFIAPGEFLVLDADRLHQPTHLDFKLPAEGGWIAVSLPDGTPLVSIDYGLQSVGVSEGRWPDGGEEIRFFELPTPGASNSATDELDSDNDGIPDAWEIANKLDPRDPEDAGIDSDKDGRTNFEEFLAGTNPQDNQDYWLIEVQSEPGETLILGFNAIPQRLYQLWTALSPNGPWELLEQWTGPETAGRIEWIDDSNSNEAQQWFRAHVERITPFGVPPSGG